MNRSLLAILPKSQYTKCMCMSHICDNCPLGLTMSDVHWSLGRHDQLMCTGLYVRRCTGVLKSRRMCAGLQVSSAGKKILMCTGL